MAILPSPKPAIARARQWARVIQRDVHAIYLAARDPRVPWYARALAFCVAGYAISPLDLIPDFIPVVGLVDDVIIVPLGIVVVLRLIPPEVLAEHRAAAAVAQSRPEGRAGATAVVLIWLAAVALAGWLCYRFFAG
jgi:uncharacterized membrane protein YkvA (DUF1232 family)